MLDKKGYLNLKKEIKFMCRTNVLKLCDDIQLNDEERKLLLYFYDGKSRIQTCMEMCISITYYTEHLKIIFNKINDYKNTLN